MAVNAREKVRSRRVSQRRQTRMIMKQQIKQLSNGVLLVRLKTKENSIAALNENGRHPLANQIKNKQQKFNKEVIAAFKNNFTFRPAYFFFSNYSENILSGQMNKIIFLNDSLQPDSAIKLSNTEFLTAEIGCLEQDTTMHFSSYYYYRGENGLEKRSAYYGGPDMGFSVLKIMSDQLIQLKRPFPYYVRTFDKLPIKRNLSKTVLKMDKKLTRYYKKNNR